MGVKYRHVIYVHKGGIVFSVYHVPIARNVVSFFVLIHPFRAFQDVIRTWILRRIKQKENMRGMNNTSTDF